MKDTADETKLSVSEGSVDRMVVELFGGYLHTYLRDERAHVRDHSASIIAAFYQQKGHLKKNNIGFVGVGCLWGWVFMGLGVCGVGCLWGWVFVGLGVCGVGCLWGWVFVGLGVCGVGCLWGWVFVGLGVCGGACLFSDEKRML